MVEPLAGEKPQEAITLTDGTKVTKTQWFGDDKLGEDDKFEEGKTYRCYVLVNSEEAFEFQDSISVKINGKDAEIYNKAKDFVTAYSDFVAGTEANKEINKVDANVEKPIVGASPKQVVISTEGVKHGKTIWRDGEYELKDTDVFEAGKTYRLIRSLGTEEGFEFRVSPPAIVMINGEEATVYPEIDKNNLGFYYDFIAGTEANKEINKVDANVEEPIVGASPKEAIISTEGIKFYETVWRDGEYELKDTDVFEAGKTYRLALALQAEEGFEFRISPPPIAKINGQEATVFHEISEKYLGFYYDFTVDAEAPLAPIITTTNLADGKVDQVYSENLVATGDTPINWSLEEGSLPEGLELDSSAGKITGTPSKETISNFKIKATNDQGHDVKEFTIKISEKPIMPLAPTITTTNLADGEVGKSYNQTLTATGDIPMTWSLEEGSLPSGLELSTSTGGISGTPTIAGTSKFKIKVTNDVGNDIKEFTIKISEKPIMPLAPTITTTNLADGEVGKSYNQTLTATGDIPMTWSLEEGSLPSGLELNISTGEVSGTPTIAGTSNFKIKVSNIEGNDIKEFTLTIKPKDIGGEPGKDTEPIDVFLPIYYSINQKAGIENGKISIDKSMAIAASKVNIELSPEKGYILDTLKVLDKNNKEIELIKNEDGSFTFTMPSSNVEVDASFIKEKIDEPYEMKFTDVKLRDWFYESVKYLDEKGLIVATDKDRFNPYETPKRYSLVSILYILEGSPKAIKNSFIDVEETSWYSDAISWAEQRNIVEGYGNGLFGPNDDITREQIARILYNYSSYKGYNISKTRSLESFTDNKEISEWAREDMAWAVASEIIKGRSKTVLSSRDKATRAEMATMLERFIKNIGNK